MSASVPGGRGICACVCKSGNGFGGGAVCSEDMLLKDKIGEIDTAGGGWGCETVGGINVVCPLKLYVLSQTNGPV